MRRMRICIAASTAQLLEGQNSYRNKRLLRLDHEHVFLECKCLARFGAEDQPLEAGQVSVRFAKPTLHVVHDDRALLMSNDAGKIVRLDAHQGAECLRGCDRGSLNDRLDGAADDVANDFRQPWNHGTLPSADYDSHPNSERVSTEQAFL